MASAFLGFRAKVISVIVTFAAGFGVYTWWQWSATQREIAQLRTAVKNLNATYPLARLVVTKQESVSGDEVRSHVRVVFLDEQGKTRREVETTLNGSQVWFEALLIQFQPPLVEKGERRTIAFPTRLYTEEIPPRRGFPLDILDEDGVPVMYQREGNRLEDLSIETYNRILKRFWYYANHPEEAARYGIDVMQGQAVFTKNQIGRYYLISVDADGGLRYQPELLWIEEKDVKNYKLDSR